MTKRDKIAFIVYLVVILLALAFGIVYLACPTVMPYHQQAIGMNWEDLGSGLQVLLTNLVTLVGAGFFTVALSCLIILLIPFRRGELWAKWAVPLVLMVSNAFCLYVTASVAAKTDASPPWQLSIVILIIVLFAYVISPGIKKQDAIKNKRREIYE